MPPSLTGVPGSPRQTGIYISEMMSAGQRSQVMLSHPHIKVSPPLVAGHPSDAHFTLALV